MRVSLEFVFSLLLISSADAYVVPSRKIGVITLPSREYRAHPVGRDVSSQIIKEVSSRGVHRRYVKQERALTIGGLTLGGPDGGITGNGLKLGGGNQRGNGTAAAEAAAPKASAEAAKPAKSEAEAGAEAGAGAGTENQPGRAEGEAAKEAALKEAEAAQGQKASGNKATEESEKFSEDSGISLDASGQAANLGGNLGITKGSDGSTSVGGSNGINVAANGQATVAGNE